MNGLHALWNGLAHVYAAMAMLPFLPFIAVYAVDYWRKRDKRRAVRMAMDVTTLFLIGSVSILFRNVTGSMVGFWIVVLLFLLFAGFIGRQMNNVRGKVNVRRLLTVVIRFAFFALALLYLLLLLIGIVQSVISSA